MYLYQKKFYKADMGGVVEVMVERNLDLIEDEVRLPLSCNSLGTQPVPLR